MDELKEVLETISEDPLEDLSGYPAALVVYTPDGPRVWLNEWHKLTPRLLDQFKVHALAKREASRRNFIRTEKEV